MNSASDSSVRRMMVAKGGRRGREGMMMMDRNEDVIGPVSEAVYEGKFLRAAEAAELLSNEDGMDSSAGARPTHSLTHRPRR